MPNPNPLDARPGTSEVTTSWQPIETAPKDGTRIWVYRPVVNKYTNHIGVDYWAHPSDGLDCCWMRSPMMCPPTHWMPLPEPPK